MVNKIALFFVVIFLFTLVSAEQSGWGSVKQNECIRLIQTCANCTSINITSINLYQNATTLLGKVAMTKNGTEYNYSFCSTSQLGTYIVNGEGNPDGVADIWVAEFEVTPTGNLLNPSQSSLYIFMLIVIIALFVLSLVGALKIPIENSRANNGEIVDVNWKKYLKLFCWAMSYLLLIVIVWFAWNLSYGYLQMRGLGTVFRYLYNILIGLALPVFAGVIILSAVSFFRDKNIQEMLNRGIPVE